MRRDEDHVTDILNAARTIARRIAGIDRASFDGNDVLQDAIIRQFEIIGEASKRISAEFRDSNPQISGGKWPACETCSSTRTIK